MTRIVAGRAGSLVLQVPDAGTRPTSDRVRESLFGSLESSGALDRAAVLDLYAGSGALGLEALSRGAASVDLVERAPRAAAVAERNARRVEKAVRTDGIDTARVVVHRSSADAFLRSTSRTYDVVLLDPPYDLGEDELAATLGLVADALEPDATVVIERSSRSPEPVLPPGLVMERQRRYGDTALWWATTSDQSERSSQSR